jgi:hypothetical protein
LASSIHKQGLLQPVGLRSDNVLVFGHRRMKAVELLGWEEIDAKIVDVTSLIEGEHDENEFRKQFTPSERVAIAAAVEEEIGERERRGRPTTEIIDEKIRVPEPTFSGRVSDFVAERSGFGTGKTYQQARRVVERGTPELIDAMDAKTVSIKNAAAITKLPDDQQREVLSRDPKEIIKAATALICPTKDETAVSVKPTKQATVNPFPLERVFSEAHRFATIAISHLEHIGEDDPHRDAALLRVEEWCKAHRKEGENEGAKTATN